MACCCGTAPCGEQNCPPGGLFICGTYTVSLSGEEQTTFDGETCCSLAVGQYDEEQRNGDTYCQFGFKVLLTNGTNGGPDFSAFDYPGRYSAQYSHNARFYSKEVSDASGCPNNSQYYQERIREEVIATAAQEETVVSDVSMSLRIRYNDCEDDFTFSEDLCLFRNEPEFFCSRVFHIQFRATRLAELVEFGSDLLIDSDGTVQVDSSNNEVTEVPHSLDWQARFFTVIDENDQCAETLPIGPRFDYHSVQPCSSIEPDNCVCVYPENDTECWGVGAAGFLVPPEPLQFFNVGGIPGPVTSVRFFDPCETLGYGREDTKSFDSSSSGSVDCYGVGPCNDTPSENPDGLTISTAYNNLGQLSHRLRITKWQFIPQAELPPIQDPNWDDGLYCA